MYEYHQQGSLSTSLRNRITQQLTTFKLFHNKLQNSFIEGLPEKDTFFVPVGQPQDLTVASSCAKKGRNVWILSKRFNFNFPYTTR
jgi:hypothetical protein